MTEAEALAYVSLYSDPESEPVLSAGDLSLLVSLARRPDLYGIRPGEDNWAETFDVHYAISQAWLVKASRVAPRYMFMSGGKMFSRQQYFDHCMKMHHKHAMKSPIKAYRLSDPEPLLREVPNNV
jgi:hypothetical protein